MMSLDKTAVEEKRRRIADFLKDFILFFAVLFFTCVVGIIELLPEFETVNGLFTWSWFAISFLYFSLLLGVDYSV